MGWTFLLLKALGILLSTYAIYEFYQILTTYHRINFDRSYRKVTIQKDRPYPNTDNPTKLNFNRAILPTRITLYHAFMFFSVKLNFYINAVFALLHCTIINYKLIQLPNTTPKDVILNVLNTSLGLFAKLSPQSGNSYSLNFQLENFAFPEILNKFDNTVILEATITVHNNNNHNLVNNQHTNGNHNNHSNGEEIKEQKSNGNTSDSFEYRIKRFEFNGIPIVDHHEQLTIITTLLATIVHPLTHSYFDQLYNYNYYSTSKQDVLNRHTLETIYPELLLHGQYLNHSSWTTPGWCFGNLEWFKQVLLFNVQRTIPHHAFHEISKQSDCVRFMLEARKILFRLVKKHGVPIDPELLFITSIVHSFEHFELYERIRWHEQRLPTLAKQFANTLNHSYLNFMVQQFYCPSHHLDKNLLVRYRKKNPFYAEWYQELCSINKKFADQITLSVAY